jgi:hypothetical protein
VWPFLIAPGSLGIGGERIENARDVHRVIMQRYAREPVARDDALEPDEDAPTATASR